MAPRTLFFVANLDPFDGSAHALYCARNAISLANNCPPGCRVVFLHASNASKKSILSLHNAPETQSLITVGIPHVRIKGLFSLNLNAVFYFFVIKYFRNHAQSGDIFCTASFSKMFQVVAKQISGRGIKNVYEIHQLEILTRGKSEEICINEIESISCADILITTSHPLSKTIGSIFPTKPCHNLGLACTYHSKTSFRAKSGPLRVGFFGSLYEEQGVQWIAKNWKSIRDLTGEMHSLHLYVIKRKSDEIIKSQPEHGVFVNDPVPPDRVPKASEQLDALIIPALDKGRLPFVAFTKVYDYPGLGLPILCSDLPTIREVLEGDKHAIFFPPGDTCALAGCISRLSNNPGLADYLVKNLRQKAFELSWDSRARRWWQSILQ